MTLRLGNTSCAGEWYLQKAESRLAMGMVLALPRIPRDAGCGVLQDLSQSLGAVQGAIFVLKLEERGLVSKFVEVDVGDDKTFPVT